MDIYIYSGTKFNGQKKSFGYLQKILVGLLYFKEKKYYETLKKQFVY